MDGSNKPRKMVYRLRPTRILPGAHYKITRQEGVGIILEVVPTDNEEIARRLSKLRYPELCQVIEVLISGLYETLNDELCIAQSVPAKRGKKNSLLLRAILHLQGAAHYLSRLSDLTCEEISPYELKARPIADENQEA